MKGSNSIRLGALMSYCAIAFNVIAGLIYTPWMIEKIGQNNYGLYTLATSFITMFTMDFGMSAAATRFITKHIAKGEQDKANRLLGLIYKLYLLIDIVIFLVLSIMYFFLDSIYAELSPQELEVFKVLYLIVGVYTIFSFPFTTLNGILTAYEKFVSLKVCDMLHKILIILLMVFALIFNQGVYALVLVNSLVGIITIVVKLFIIKHTTPIRACSEKTEKGTMSQFFSFSAWTTVASLAQRLVFNITPSIIAALSSSGAIGVSVFGLAATIEGYIFTFANAINGMFMPKISRIVHNGKNKDELLDLMIKVGRLQCMLIGILVFGFAALGKTFIVDIWNKPNFSSSYICTIFLILPSFMYLPMQIAHTTMVVENKVKLRAIIYVSIGVLNVVISLFLSRKLGAIGAALSIFVAYSVRAIVMIVVYQRELGFNMFKFFKSTYFSLVPHLLIAYTIGVICTRFNPITNVYLKFLIDGGIMIGSYVAIMWIKGFNVYEKNLILSLFNKFRR